MKFKHIGSGIGFRPELKSYIFMNRDKIDFLEIIADHYIDVPEWKMQELELLKQHFTIIPHAINLSVGSAQGIDKSYLDKLSSLINYINPPYWSEHISYTQAHASDVGHLSPIIYNTDFLKIMENNVGLIHENISTPLILENITYHVEMPGKQFGDVEFLNELCNKTNIGLLLDLTNLYINSRNFKFDPFAFIDELNLENIVQLHYVGYQDHPFQIIDSHARQTQEEIFDLMSYLLKKHIPAGILLERDERYEFETEITSDLERTKTILYSFPHAHA